MGGLPMHAPEWVTVARVFRPGVILGVVDLVDVHGATPDDLGRIRCATTQPGEPWGMACSEWAMETAFHLVLANPRPLATPIPWRGALGLWPVPADLEAQIRACLLYTSDAADE